MIKPALPLLLFVLILSSWTASAATISSISTLRGKVYRRCEIVKVHPDGVSFTHSKGAAKVLFMDLSSEWRVRLGYNKVEADSYERELAAKRQRQVEARAARQAELGHALAVAQEMEINRLRLAQQHAAAMILAVSATNNAGYGYSYPLLPALGSVWDGGSFRRQYRRGGQDRWDNDGRYYQPNWGGYSYQTFGTPLYIGNGFRQPSYGPPACNGGFKGSTTLPVKP